MSLNRNAQAFVLAAENKFGIGATLTRDDINRVVKEDGVPYPYWFTNKAEYRIDRGSYKLPELDNQVTTKEPEMEMALQNTSQVLVFKQPKLIDESDPSIPEKFPDYVPFGFFKDLMSIVKTKSFYPVFITGLSGNGKTLMVEQVCAELNRECIRVNISIETDESDLLGGPTLVNGNVVNRDGPVITAMKRGAVLLIDEVDRGSNKLMCLQGILEGKPYYNKKNGELVHAKQGFTVIATANTKGQGSDEGRFLAQILDSAFLERFVITVEQEFPDKRVEKKILTPLISDTDFVDCLTNWADVVRQSHKQGAIDEIISTRRLVHIAKTFAIFKDRMKAIELCVSRFDEQTKTAFLDLYSKIDVKVEAPVVEAARPAHMDEVPF
jgi:MoxR-like ATPase